MALERPQRQLGGGTARRFQPRGGYVGAGAPPARGVPTRPLVSTGPQAGPGAGSFLPPGRSGSLSPLERIAERYSRPNSSLDLILRVLSLPENVISGYASGVAEGLDDGDLAPWTFVKAMGLGFSEIPSAVQEGMTWQQFLVERSDPNSFWHKNANVIGLGMSVFFDPTMYVTFGSTGASRIAARQVLARGWQQSADEAVQYMSNGMRHPATGKHYSPKDDIDEVMAEIHLAYNDILPHSRPFTMGDALQRVRDVDRAGEAGLYRQIFARGGRGTRFAGMQIPGTARAGQAIAERFRSQTNEVLSMKGTGSFLARAFVPDAKLKAISEDARRAIALGTFREIETFAQTQGEKMVKQAADIAKIDNPIARGVAGLFGRPVEYVPQAERRGLLRAETKASTAQQQGIVRMANLRKAEMFKAANDAGFDKGQLREMHDLWDRLVARHDDPVAVVAQFLMRTNTRILSQKQIEKVLENPLLARRLDENIADVVPMFPDKATQATMKLAAMDPEEAYGRYINQQTRGGMRGLDVAHVMSKDEFIASYRKAGLEFGTEIVTGAAKAVEDIPRVKEGRGIASIEDYEKVIKGKAKPFKWKGKEYAVSDAVYEALEQLRNPAFVDVEMNRFFGFMNGLQNLWKIPATVMNPAFHAMNLVGGAWNNMLAGPYGPIDYIESWARVTQRRIMAGEASVAGKAALTAAKPILRRRNMDPELTERLFTEFEKRGGGGRSGFISAEISTGLARDIAQRTGDRPWLPRFRRGFETGRAFTAARRTLAGLGAAEIGTNIAASQGWIDDFDIPLGNEFAALALGSPEIARAGRFTASYVEEVLRLTPFNEAWKDKSLRQAMEAIGPITPPQFAKMGPKSLTKKQEAALFDLGTEMSIHFQFDYTKLTPIERTFAKSVFPFWTFYKNNFMLQAREVVNRPRFIQGFYHLANYLEDESSELTPEMEELLPEYFSNLGAFQVPVPPFAREVMGLPADTPLYLNPKLPFTSLNLFPPFWELFNEDSQLPLWQRAAQVVAPVGGSVGPFSPLPIPGSKLMFEAITGHNIGLARPIDYQRASSSDWRQSFTPAPGYFKYLPGPLADLFGAIQNPTTGELIMPATYKYIADSMSTPFITNYGKVVPTAYEGERRDKAKADLVSWMTGLRLMPVDTLKISRAWGYRMESVLESKRAELREQGLELETEDEVLLRQTRAFIKSVEDQWDIRERELFGG